MTENIHTLDVLALDEYLKSEIDDFKGVLESKKFNTGQSNPTYLLDSGEKKYVLRKNHQESYCLQHMPLIVSIES